jgi:serine/threonine-protein kinase
MELSSSDWVKLNKLLDEVLELAPARRQQWVDALPPEHAKVTTALRDALAHADGPPTRDILTTFPRQPPKGAPLDRYVREHALSLDRKLAVWLNVARTVAFAHDRRIDHGSVEPAAILVGSDGEARLMSFGPARPQLSSIAADVCSLGALLYWLLTGSKPDVDPVPLTHGMSRKKARALRGDLESIVAKALSRRAENRYESVGAFIEDIARYQHRLPVSARRSSWIYRLRKFAARHAAYVVSAVAALGALLLGFWFAI